MPKKYILAVDPGKVSGVALISLETGSEPVLEWSGEVEQVDFSVPLREFLWAPEIKNNLDVVCERFIINAQTVRNSQSPFSLEQIGILKQCLIDAKRSTDEIIFQSPADAKALFPNQALKTLNCWHKGGEGHALDAIRHALLRAVKLGWKPVKLLKD